jgi:hypothetical protein
LPIVAQQVGPYLNGLGVPFVLRKKNLAFVAEAKLVPPILAAEDGLGHFMIVR